MSRNCRGGLTWRKYSGFLIQFYVIGFQGPDSLLQCTDLFMQQVTKWSTNHSVISSSTSLIFIKLSNNLHMKDNLDKFSGCQSAAVQ